MDDFEKRVLKKRRATLQDDVTVSMDLLSALRKFSVISEDMVEIIMTEKTNPARVHKLVDFLMGSPRMSAFDDMCAALMTSQTDLSWLAKELQTDVRAERGNLVIDDDVMKEASMLVHRKFGTSKRFSEIDKRDMTELIAVKIQVSKEEWRQELEQVRQELHSRTHAVKTRDKQIRTIREEMVRFIKDHDHQLVSRAHGMVTTSDVLRSSVADDDLLAILDQTTRYIFGRVHKVLKERQILLDEREKCLKILRAKEGDKDKPLDELLIARLDELPKVIERHQSDLNLKDQMVERQRTIIRELELEIEDKEEEIGVLKEQVAKKTGEIGVLNSKVMANERAPEEGDSSGSSEVRANGAGAPSSAKAKGRRKSKKGTAAGK